MHGEETKAPYRNAAKSSGWFVVAGVVALLLTFFMQEVLSSRANTITWDEPDHIYAGYRQWQGDFGLNPEHPPLLKFVATLPLRFMHLNVPELESRPYRLEAVLGGRDFIFHNDADKLVFRAHLAASIFSLLLLLLVFLAAREMFGSAAGWIALALMAFDPTLVAHGALVTTDAIQACFLFASIYAFYRYVKAPSWVRLAITGLSVGLALASKHSAVLLLPMLVLLAAVEVLGQKKSPSISTQGSLSRRGLRYLGALCLIAAIAIVTLWGTYGFRFHAREDGRQLNPPLSAQLAHVPSHAEAEVLAEVARFHLLPESYIYGFAHVLFSAKSFNSYVFGKSYPHAVWFYFPAAMLVKSSLTFLLLLGGSLWVMATGRLRKHRELMFLLIPAIVYLLMSMAGGMNIGIRHILPVYIFLEVAIAGAAAVLVRQSRAWLAVVVVLLVFQAVSVSRAFPAYVSYANEAFGGPKNVWKYMSDSSAEWGQQLHAVKRYADEHNLKHCWFVYFGTGVIDYDYYHIPCKLLPTVESIWLGVPSDAQPTIDGPLLISAVDLSGFEFGPPPLNPYEQFKSLKPADVIDSGVFVFNGHFAIPLAAALAHAQKAEMALSEKNLSTALQEAQQAVALAPASARVNASMGHVLDALGKKDEARPYYESALESARSVQPEFQQSLIGPLKRRLSQ